VKWTDSRTIEIAVTQPPQPRKNWLPLIFLALVGAVGAVVAVSEHDWSRKTY